MNGKVSVFPTQHRFLSDQAANDCREWERSLHELRELGCVVTFDQESGRHVVKPFEYRKRELPFLEVVCDMEDLPKVRDMVRLYRTTPTGVHQEKENGGDTQS